MKLELRALCVCVALMTSAVGCADENDPKTWVKRLDDPARRSEAIGRLKGFFEMAMQESKNNREDAKLKKVLDVSAEPLAKTLTLAAICLANEMVGGAERLRETSLDYAKMRMQFGKPIASFQSMKHKQADMLIDAELAKSAAYYAAAAADDNTDDLAMVASLAKACASDAYLQMAIHAIQIRGGIGFTWDEDTHLWFKRAKSSEIMLGDATYHRELMMQNWAA